MILNAVPESASHESLLGLTSGETWGDTDLNIKFLHNE